MGRKNHLMLPFQRAQDLWITEPCVMTAMSRSVPR